MKLSRSLLALAGVVLLATCAQPPQAAIDAAKSALEAAAGNQDVITYAPDSLRAAQDAAAALDTELAAQLKKPALMRRFDMVKTLAAAAKAAAMAAVTDAASAKTHAAQDAAALVDEVTASIGSVESKIWAARGVPRIKLDVINDAALAPTRARGMVEDAQKDIDAGAFAAAKAKLLAAKVQLATSEETILEQTRIAHSR